MDRTAMNYRDAAATSQVASATGEDSRTGENSRPAARGEYCQVTSHRRSDGAGSHHGTHQGSHLGGRGVQTVNLQSILQGAREAIIDFDGAAYRLRITRNHRLILTK